MCLLLRFGERDAVQCNQVAIPHVSFSFSTAQSLAVGEILGPKPTDPTISPEALLADTQTSTYWINLDESSEIGNVDDEAIIQSVMSTLGGKRDVTRQDISKVEVPDRRCEKIVGGSESTCFIQITLYTQIASGLK